MAKNEKKVLISTLYAFWGGVPSMLSFIASTLEERGYTPVFAAYLPYRMFPDCSIPSYYLPFRWRTGQLNYQMLDRYEATGLGAYLPELEFTHYWPTNSWQKLIAECDHHLVVSGNILAGWPLLRTGTPYLAWVATAWGSDRANRVQTFSVPRRLLDRCINSPVLKYQEKAILQGGSVLALSDYTRKELDAIATPKRVDGILSMPIDCELFRPDPERISIGRIGFTGRFDDPRKNIDLLLDAMALLRGRGLNITADLIGSDSTEALESNLTTLGLSEAVNITGRMGRTELAKRLPTFDAFVIPSHQEGLCISGLEAMACGCPVISTRCGGPEEFVRDGDTGFLVDFDASSLADALHRVIVNRELRNRLALSARHLIETNYSTTKARDTFWSAFTSKFLRA